MVPIGDGRIGAVLIRNETLQRIAAGEVDTLFRRQKRPTVKAGGTLRMMIGILAIDSVERVEPDDVTDDDARRAGMTRDAVLSMLAEKSEGGVLPGQGARGGRGSARGAARGRCPGPGFRCCTARTAGRLDAASSWGEWTRATLRLIGERPFVRAPDLAASMGRETLPFKEDVRKLKALGLTISHSPGYELSPRGRALMERL